MLDMGFEEPIRDIVGRTPPSRQTLLFSATYPEAIREMARTTLRDPIDVTVAAHVAQPQVEQWFFEVEPANKPDSLAALLMEHKPESTVVFCNMRRDTETVVDALARHGISALALHGDIEQRDRDEVLVRFANRSCRVLVASDVAARGLDIKDLAAVVNYELPPDPDIYLHRIGRTGRAGSGGLALSLCAPREIQRAHLVEEQQGAPLAWRKISPLDRQRTPCRRRYDAAHRRGRSDKLRPGDIPERYWMLVCRAMRSARSTYSRLRLCRDQARTREQG
jgi:ATP-independent RNA helicase DbpA